MDRKIIQTREFSKDIDAFIKKRSLLVEDFDDFKKQLAENPKMGDPPYHGNWWRTQSASQICFRGNKSRGSNNHE